MPIEIRIYGGYMEMMVGHINIKIDGG